MNRIDKLLHYTFSFNKLLFLPVFLILSVCTVSGQNSAQGNKEVVHSVYFTANTGIRSNNNNQLLLQQIVEASKKEDSSSLVIIGNLVPEKGYPNKDDGREQSQAYLEENLLSHIKDFKGRVIFTPGVNEWQEDAPDNIDDLESFLQDNSRGKFWPNDGCPIEGKDLSDDVYLLMVDSQWYIEDWDDHG